MDIKVLDAARRDKAGSAAARRLREAGRVPAVLYGHGGEVVSLSVDGEALDDLLGAEAHAVDVKVGGDVQRALIKDVQFDTWGEEPLHVDFARVSMDETVVVTVSVETHGTPKAVEAGAILEHPVVGLDVECRVDAIPNHFVVEVGEMEIGDVIEAGDIPLPEGVALASDPHAVVAVLRPPHEEEEEAPEEAEEGAAEPEVIGREKEGEEEESEER